MLLCSAAERGYPDVVCRAIDLKDADPNFRTFEATTPLHYAKSARIVSLLRSSTTAYGVSPDCVDAPCHGGEGGLCGMPAARGQRNREDPYQDARNPLHGSSHGLLQFPA